MDFKTHLKESERFLSANFIYDEKDLGENRLRDMVERTIKMGDDLDHLKKSKYYGEELPSHLSSQRVQTSVQQFKRDDERAEKMLHAVIGIVTESTELLKAIYDDKWGGKEFDKVNCFEEMGDLTWYMAIIYREMGFTQEEVFERNIKKLDGRYKKGKFTTEDAINRDLNNERNILEGK